MKKLVVSPSTAQTQTSPISGSRSISPCPAITPPAITTVSPGATRPDEGAGLEERQHADEHVGPRAERLGDVLDQLLRVGQRRRARRSRRRRARARAATPSALRSRLEPAPAPDDVRRHEHGGHRGERSRRADIARTVGDAQPAEPRHERARDRRRPPPRPRPRSSNRPKQVGPEPLTAAPSAPGRAEARRARRRARAAATSAAGSRSFSSAARPARRRPARRARAAARGRAARARRPMRSSSA